MAQETKVCFLLPLLLFLTCLFEKVRAPVEGQREPELGRESDAGLDPGTLGS